MNGRDVPACPPNPEIEHSLRRRAPVCSTLGVGLQAASSWFRRCLLLQDLQYAIRMLSRSPGFTATVVVTLGLGIGVNTSIFTLLNAIAIRPLPVKDAERVVRIYQNVKAKSGRTIYGSVWMASNEEYETYRRRLQSFSGLAAWAEAS